MRFEPKAFVLLLPKDKVEDAKLTLEDADLDVEALDLDDNVEGDDVEGDDIEGEGVEGDGVGDVSGDVDKATDINRDVYDEIDADADEGGGDALDIGSGVVDDVEHNGTDVDDEGASDVERPPNSMTGGFGSGAGGWGDDEHHEDDEKTDEEEGDEEELAVELDVPVYDIDPADLFDGMLTDIPDPTEQLDAGDVLRSKLDECGSYDHTFATDFSRHPYIPNPIARALDSVTTFDPDDEDAQDIVMEIRGSTAMTSRVIASGLRRVLSAKATNRRIRDRTRGRLDRRRLHTLNRPGTTRPNRRVFEETIQGVSTKVAIAVLVDQSGSMNHAGKIDCARQATIALGDALHSLSSFGVTFQAFGFDADNARLAPFIPGTDRRAPLRLYVYKEANENWNRVLGRVGYMGAHLGNCDGECVRWAAKRLLSVKADRHILIVLSDGQPACATGSTYSLFESWSDTREREIYHTRIKLDLNRAVNDVTKAGVDVLGIGIMSGAVQTFYPNNIVIHSATDLESTVMNAIRDLILGKKTLKVVS